jgi:hypothetical protein
MAQSSLQQALARKTPAAPHNDRKQLLDKILSPQNAILEFDLATGELKEWEWYTLSHCNNAVVELTVWTLIGPPRRNLKAAAFPCTILQGIALHIGSYFCVASAQSYSARLPNQ